jgi:alpha-glucosidase
LSTSRRTIDRPWWHGSTGYEVYLRSFADGNGDGVGDLPGLLGRLDYLAWLGIDLVWVTPFYPSPMHDHGYDVSDYCDVDPIFGDLDIFDAVVRRSHELGLRLVVDLIPNHTSIEHPWFRAARSSREDAYRDYYIWHDPAPDGGPPNNWLATFGGRAWSFDPVTEQYYCHLHLSDQPDLNWANPAVREAFEGILRFWLDRGVDGFRVDVAHGLVKDARFRDNPPSLPEERMSGAGRAASSQVLRRVHDVNQPGVLDVYRRWRAIAEEYDALLLGEVFLRDPHDLARYVRDDDGLHLTFWFEPLQIDWEPAAIRKVLVAATEAMPDRVGWIQGTHDRTRSPTRFGGGEAGRHRSLALATLLAGLPGIPFIYQGEELGMEDVDVPAELMQDPIAVRQGEYASSRDGCRTPIPWEPGPGLGFTEATTPWLPFGDHDGQTVAEQRSMPRSLLQRYRELIALRRDRLADGAFAWLADDGPVVAYRRGDLVVAANCGQEVVDPSWLRTGTVLFDTGSDRRGPTASMGPLLPDHARILELPMSD